MGILLRHFGLSRKRTSAELLRRSVLLVVVAAGAGGMLLSSQTPKDETAPIYLDRNQPVSVRVDDLMSRMTLKEKVGQLNLPCVYVIELGKDIPSKTDGVPQVCGRDIHSGNWSGLRVSSRSRMRYCTRAPASRPNISMSSRRLH